MDYMGNIQYEIERKAVIVQHCACTDQVRILIDEVAITSLDDGLRQTVNWYQREFKS